MTKEEIQFYINLHTSNMIRHQGNVLELRKQVIQTQAELDFESDQMVLCISMIDKYKEMLKEANY